MILEMENTPAQDENIQKLEDQITPKQVKALVAGAAEDLIQPGDDEDLIIAESRRAAKDAIGAELQPITDQLQKVVDTRGEIETQGLVDHSKYLGERRAQETTLWTEEPQKDLKDGPELTKWEIEKAKIELDGALELLKFFGGIPTDPELRSRMENSLKRMHFIPYETDDLKDALYLNIGKYADNLGPSFDELVELQNKWQIAGFKNTLDDSVRYKRLVDMVNKRAEEKKQELEAKDEGVDIPEPEELDTPQRAIEVEIPQVTRDTVSNLEEIRARFTGVDIKDKLALERAIAAQLDKLGI